MRSTLLAVLALIAMSSTAFGRECTNANGEDILNNPDLFQAEIRVQQTCSDAADLARACAWGSSLDVGTVAAAEEVCYLEMAKQRGLTRTFFAMLERLEKDCDKKYESEDGTLYRSLHAYCRLDALEWLVNRLVPKK